MVGKPHQKEWYKVYQLLCIWIIENDGQIPTRTQNSQLCNWLKRQKVKYLEFIQGKMFNDKSFWEYMARIELLAEVGVDLSPRPRGVKAENPSPKTDFYGWKMIIPQREQRMNFYERQKDHDDRIALKNYLNLFKAVKATGKRSAWNILDDVSSIPQYVLWCFKVGDIDWKECTQDAPIYNIRYILSYVLYPYSPTHAPIQPTDFIEHGLSSYFSYSRYRTPEIDNLLDAFLTTLPKWCIELWKKKKKIEKEELISLISSDDNVWFDKFMVSKLGDNPAGGGVIITESDQPGARRMLLSSEVHGKRYSEFWQCNLEEGYGYSYSFLPKCWMGARCLRDYPHLTELVVEVWKQVWHHLDPVSQQCPPNAVGLLWYFGMFGGKIRPHQDACVRMAVDPSHNSQLLGSSVMCISLFSPQEFILTPVENNDAPPVGLFLTEHASVYILSCQDDAKWKHRCQFPNGKTEKYRQKVRLAIVCRWLGRRTKMFCDDRHDWRRFREVYLRVDKVLEQKFPKNKKNKEIFKLDKQRKDTKKKITKNTL
jgi:hypothetical protein